MATDESILKEGVDAWNAWRSENPDIRPDLSGANLSKAYLSRANLSEAYLTLRSKVLQGQLVYRKVHQEDWRCPPKTWPISTL